MKYLSFLLISFSLFAFNYPTTENTNTVRASLDIEKEIRLFLADFETAVLSHDAERIMSFMQDSYVSQQRDQFLKGRTDQFLNEFFGGLKYKSKQYVSLKYRDVKKMKLIQLIHEGPDYYSVGYLIKTKKGKVFCEWSVHITFSSGNVNFGLVGAVG
jgi:hypothetical protein